MLKSGNERGRNRESVRAWERGSVGRVGALKRVDWVFGIAMLCGPIFGSSVMAKLTINDLNVRGKRVFLRVDYNVPLEEKEGQMVITDATGMVKPLPTLRRLSEQGGK